jgi:hypothetical protein
MSHKNPPKQPRARKTNVSDKKPVNPVIPEASERNTNDTSVEQRKLAPDENANKVTNTDGNDQIQEKESQGA